MPSNNINRVRQHQTMPSGSSLRKYGNRVPRRRFVQKTPLINPVNKGVIGQDYYPLQDVILPAYRKIKRIIKDIYNQVICKFMGRK